jgi:polyhydroxyalkanoate synthesis regulator phasin
MKLNKLAVAVTSAVLLMAGNIALADSTSDIVNVLVDKGILTPEEGKLISKNSVEEKKKAQASSGKIKISDAIESATIYGDIRARYEDRQVTNTASPGVDYKLDRPRYKITFGVKTDSGQWYSDLAFAMGSAGRSDNADLGMNVGASSLGATGTVTNAAQANLNAKQAIYLKRAMIGYKPTDWLTVEAGRFNTPLYITPMVWDYDLTVEGLAEQVKYKLNDSNDIFLTAVQNIYSGDRKLTGGVPQATSGIAYGTAMQYAFQGGIKSKFNDNTSAKAAITYTTISKNPYTTNFGTGATATAAGTGLFGANDLSTIDIPAEINYMASSNVGLRLFGDYVWNTSADDRAKASGIAAAANGSSGSDDSAWMLGIHVGSAKDLKGFESGKMAKGDWSARLWYQEVGVWALDAAQVDSDMFDSRVNIKGTTFKAQYNIEDAVALNFAYAHGEKKNNNFYALGSGDMGADIHNFDLYQLDLTYKF